MVASTFVGGSRMKTDYFYLKALLAFVAGGASYVQKECPDFGKPYVGIFAAGCAFIFLYLLNPNKQVTPPKE